MRIKALAVVLLLVAGIFQVGLTIFSTTVSSGTLYVGGGGPSNYTTIQDAINVSLPGDTIFVYSGTYYENVIVNKTVTLVGEDKAMTRIDGMDNGITVNITSDWVNISGFTITNAGGTWNSAGISVFHADNCTIAKSTLFWNSAIGIQIFHSNGTEVAETNLTTNGQTGILLFSSYKSTMHNVTIHESSIFGIYLHSSGYNTFDNITMYANTFGIGLYLSDYNTFYKNTGHTTMKGFELEQSYNNTIVHNDISDSDVGIHLFEAGYNLILNNNVSSNINHGILILVSDNNTISRNEAAYNGNDGISLQSGHNNTVSGNNVTNNTNGIYLLNSFLNNITGNRVLRNQHGIYTVISKQNLIADNNFSHNTGHGLYITSSRFNTIARNNVSSNGDYGFNLGFSWNNTIFHNNIINNKWQARDDRDTNQWDDGYPSGGNYWSNYTGVDMFSGPNYSVPGSDGFGDSPFIIDADSQDRYPLMSPYPPTGPIAPTPTDAFLSGLGLEDVTLTWNLSYNDGRQPKPVIRYDIFRHTSYDVTGTGYPYLASVPNGTVQYVDALSGEGDPNSYFYRICAVDIDNRTSCGVRQLSKFTRPLTKGQNLVSIPLQPSDESLGTVLQTVSFDKAWYYDPSEQEWKSRIAGKPYSKGLESLNLTMGLWISVLVDSNLTVAGLVPEVTVTQLYGGWNLVGFPSFLNYSVTDLNVAVTAESVEAFDALVPLYHLEVLQESAPLLAGHGYWVKVSGNRTWILSNI